MSALSVVKVKVFEQSFKQITSVLVSVDKNVFVLHASPKSFDENIVRCSSFSVHADFCFCSVKNRSELYGCELAALVCVEDFGSTEVIHCILQTGSAKIYCHRVR